MVISISLGWWLLPAAVTVASYGVAFTIGAYSATQSPHGGDYNFGAAWDALIVGILLLIATVVSLATWLLWTLLGGAA